MIEKRKIQVILFLFTFLRYLNYSFLALTSGAALSCLKTKKFAKGRNWTANHAASALPFRTLFFFEAAALAFFKS